eukprot:m51a1_g14388 hypothetical protein (394) ;mRNA; f:315497-316833
MNSYISQHPIVPLRFSVSVDSPSATYLMGQPITGHVFFSLPASIRAKSVTIELVAESRVRLLLFGGRAVSKAVPASRHRIGACRPSTALWVPPFMGDCRLPAGNSSLPFALDTSAFPSGMPGSLDGAYGSIRYVLRARIERHSFDNTGHHYAELGVRMLPAVNVEWSALAKASETASSSGVDVQLSAIVGHTGFLAGDSAGVEVRVANSSRSKCVEAVRVALVQKSAFACGELSRADSRSLDTCQALEVPVGPGGSAVASATLRVPADAHPTVANKHVSLAYFVRVEALGAHGAVLAKATAPVVVGTVRVQRPAERVADVGNTAEASNAAQTLQEQREREEALEQSHGRSRSCAGCAHESDVSDSESESSCSSEGVSNLRASGQCRTPIDLLA